MEIKERIAYIRGLLEGADFYGRDERGRAVWENLLGVCGQLADSIAALEEEQAELGAYLEAVDADLADLEEAADVPEYVVVECPHCGEEVCFEEEFLYDDSAQVACPECGGDIKEAEAQEVALEASTPGGVGAGSIPAESLAVKPSSSGWNSNETQSHQFM